MKHNLRLFVAIPLPASLISALEPYAEKYANPGIRLVPPENWHVTVHFIGNVPAAKLPEIKQNLAALAPSIPPFSLKVLRIAPGPTAKNARLVWAEFGAGKAFEKLVRQTTFALGGKMEFQHPVAHVTLARYAKFLIKPPKLPMLTPSENLYMEANGFALFESEPGGQHPTYTPLATFTFENGNNTEEN